jgi:hypothetical protein
MRIIKLTSDHVNSVRPLFEGPNYMGVQAITSNFSPNTDLFADLFHRFFTATYLSGLQNYHAYGAIDDDGIVQCYIGFYESIDDAAWYWNHLRSFGDPKLIKEVLDVVIKHNEERGRLKFYSMFPKQYTNTYRRLAFSKLNSERYDYFDEFEVKAKTMCKYTLPWQILFNRTLVPTDVTVRCTFLKQQYRTQLPQSGHL